MSIFRGYVSEKHVEVLRLYLDGVTNEQIIAQALPDGWAGYSSQEGFNKIMASMRLILKMPNKKSFAIAQKEVVLKNLEIYLAHNNRAREFFDMERERIIKEGFVDLNDYGYD